MMDSRGKSVLHLAAERGNVGLVKHLLSLPQASSMMEPDAQGRSVLHYATASRRFHLINDLVKDLPLHIKQKDHQGRTLLHHAALRNNLEAVEQVLDLDMTQLEAQDNDGKTPLQLAKIEESETVADFLKSRFPHLVDSSNSPDNIREEVNTKSSLRQIEWRRPRPHHMYLILVLLTVLFALYLTYRA